MDIYEDEKEVSFRSWSKLKKSLHQEGYREGSSAGRNLTFQKGFDSGYDSGFNAGYNLGLHNGILKYHSSQLNITEHKLEEKISKVEFFNKPSSGLCLICSEDKDQTGNDQPQELCASNVADLKEKQEKLMQNNTSLLTEEYASVLKTSRQ